MIPASVLLTHGAPVETQLEEERQEFRTDRELVYMVQRTKVDIRSRRPGKLRSTVPVLPRERWSRSAPERGVCSGGVSGSEAGGCDGQKVVCKAGGNGCGETR